MCLAIDIGGSKLAAGLVCAEGLLAHRRQVATPVTDDPDVLFSALAGLVHEVLGPGPGGRAASGEVVVCGVGCGGPMSRDRRLVSPLNIPAWRDFPLAERLERLTGMEVWVDNDAKAFTRGEAWRGAGLGISDFLGMVVSTGVGGGIVLDGRLLEGASGNAGHVGHVMVEPEGRICGCGARGCLEAEASGSAIAAVTGLHPARATPEIVMRTGRLVGRAVASVANLLDLELAVVAGSVALGFGAPFFSAANDELSRRARLSFSKGATITPAALGDTGPLVGAAAVGWHGTGRELSGVRR